MPDLSALPKARDDNRKAPPKFVARLVPHGKHESSVPESTGAPVESAQPGDVPSAGMTHEQERQRELDQELVRESKACWRAEAELQDVPVALYESEIS